MIRKIIHISGINDTIELYNQAQQSNGDVTIRKGYYYIDAKSLEDLMAIDMKDGVIIEYSDERLNDFISKFEHN